MTQGVLPFKYEEEKNERGMTALAGLPIYLDLARVVGLSASVAKHVKIRKNSQGWTDQQMLTALILLNLAGGTSVDDLRILNADPGFCEILRKTELCGLKRKERRELEKRWRKEKKRFVPSPSSMFRYLSGFHDAEQEKVRTLFSKSSFIPAPNNQLRGLVKVNADLCQTLNIVKPHHTATLDMDATLVETDKKDALYCYKGFKSYQPLNTWWAEQGIILHSEFRDGNVPAGHEQLRVFKEALACLPENVVTVKLRSDTAGYQHELLKYCERGMDKRFGRIEFAIGCNVTNSFKQAVSEVADKDWRPVYKTVGNRQVETGTQWAEVCFVPKKIGLSQKGFFRYIAKRQAFAEQSFPGMEDPQMSLPFPVMEMKSRRYKIFGMVTNISEADMNGEEIIHWLHTRCGKSEEVHSIMKADLAGGTLPCGEFGKNAAWWWIMILSLNLNMMMKKLALEPSMVQKRMKAIRFSIINLPGRVIKRSRQLILRISKSHPSFNLLIAARKRIAMLQTAPSG